MSFSMPEINKEGIANLLFYSLDPAEEISETSEEKIKNSLNWLAVYQKMGWDVAAAELCKEIADLFRQNGEVEAAKDAEKQANIFAERLKAPAITISSSIKGR